MSEAISEGRVIDGPGRYPTERGKVATIRGPFGVAWIGSVEGEDADFLWFASGERSPACGHPELRIVGPRITDAPAESPGVESLLREIAQRDARIAELEAALLSHREMVADVIGVMDVDRLPTKDRRAVGLIWGASRQLWSHLPRPEGA